ncbi:MAG: helix-turn-helix transcriptional regulator [Nocardioides sp.]|uniref:helix-turn-helix domain-containing protein n=1 Tax=Nocardioides sp. TaxID=35761 RepID=UPI0032630155
METNEKAASPPLEMEISGMIRRVRRLATWSQRELAHELGVSQSAVAKWETGRTTPSARMLARVLDLAKLSLAAVKQGGDRGVERGVERGGDRAEVMVAPMKVVTARDAANRRYPAHTFVWTEGWWAPEGAEMTAWWGQILCRSKELELPRVRYSRRWGAWRRPTPADLADHPTWRELVAEAREGWQPRGRPRAVIPEWALADTRKLRNRRPEEFRALVPRPRRE